jgi:hypothetical protein
MRRPKGLRTMEVAMKNFLRTMIGAALMKPETYETVEADRSTTASALLVVVIASIAAALGTGTRSIGGIVSLTLAALVTWMVWIGLTLVIGRQLMPVPETRTNMGEVFRTTGFSAAPGVLRIFAGIPGVGLPILIATTVWMLLTFVVAVRQALDLVSFNRALAVCLLGWIIHGILFFAFVAVAV